MAFSPNIPPRNMSSHLNDTGNTSSLQDKTHTHARSNDSSRIESREYPNRCREDGHAPAPPAPPHRPAPPTPPRRDFTSINFVIPPPSRKYTTTNPGTLSPIYHLVYDLTAPTTITTTTFRETVTNAVSPGPNHPLSPRSPRRTSRTSGSHFHPGNFDFDGESPDLGHDGRTGHSSCSSGPAVTGGCKSSDYPADKRRTSNKKDWRSRDAKFTHHNKTRGENEVPFSSTEGDSVVGLSDNGRHSFLSHSKRREKASHGPRQGNHGQKHGGVKNDDVFVDNQNGDVHSGHLGLTSLGDQTNVILSDSDSHLTRDIWKVKSRLGQSTHDALNIATPTDKRGDNSRTNKVGDNRHGEAKSLTSGGGVKKAIDIWTNRSKGANGIADESNSGVSYRQGDESTQGSSTKRAVFQREGDCVRLVIVNGEEKSDNNSIHKQCKDTRKRDIQPVTALSEPGAKFKREEKSNSSQRWLKSKLALLSPRGGNNTNNSKTTGKGDRKKDSKNSKNNSLSSNQSAPNDKAKNKEDDTKPNVSKKPVNRWDSILVHGKHAFSSANGSQIQTGLSKEECFAQAGTAHLSPGQTEACLSQDVTFRHRSDWARDAHVTEKGPNKVASKPAIKGILVNKSNAYQQHERRETRERLASDKHNGVQFIDDTDKLLSQHNFSHTSTGLLSSSSSLSSSFSSAVSSTPRREVIDRSKYIINQRNNSTHPLNRSHDSALTFENDPVSRLDHLIGVPVTNNRTPEADQSLGSDPSIIKDVGRSEVHHSTNPRVTGLNRKRGETWTSSDTTLPVCLEPDSRGYGDEIGAEDSVHKRPNYNPLVGGCSDRVGHQKGGQVKKISQLAEWPNDRSRVGIPDVKDSRDFERESNRYPHSNSETFQASTDNRRIREQVPSFPDSDKVSTLTSGTECKHEEEDRVGLAGHSTMTSKMERDNSQVVEGDETLRYRRALREVGKKNQNLYNADHSPNSQWIKNRLGDINQRYPDSECIVTPQRDADTRGPSSVVSIPRSKPVTKPKITPRQKFEISHNLPPGRIATNLRDNNDRLDPQLSIKSHTHGDLSSSRHANFLSNFTSGAPSSSSHYKESPRAKFERDRAARSHGTIPTYTLSPTTPTAINGALYGSTPCFERLNKSCDDLDLETDSDGYLKPIVSHKSHSTETLLSHSAEPRALIVVPNLKLTPRARFENSRLHGNLSKAQKSVSSHELARGDNFDPSDLGDGSWPHRGHDLNFHPLLKPVQYLGHCNDNQIHSGQSSTLNSGLLSPYSQEQRNRLITSDVRSVQARERLSLERDKEVDLDPRRGGEGRGEDRYGTSVNGEERFLSKQHAARLASTANIDTNAPSWSGAGHEEGIITIASEERRTKQLNKSQPDRHVGGGGVLTTGEDRLIISSGPHTDTRSVRQDTRLVEENCQVSSVNCASSHESFAISKHSQPLGIAAARTPLEDANSANRPPVSELVDHGAPGGSTEPPRPPRVAVVKKMSPDSVSSSGYESEHTSSAILHKTSTDLLSKCALDVNINDASKRQWRSNSNNNSLEGNSTGVVSTVRELRLRFGHNQQQQQQQHQQTQFVDSRFRYSDSTKQHNFNDKDRFGSCIHQDHVGDHVILADDQYDDSIVHRPHANNNNNNNNNRNNNKTQFSPTRHTDVNNNKAASNRRRSVESDSCVRYDHSKHNSKSIHANNEDCRTRNQHTSGFNSDSVFSDSQLLDYSSRKRVVNFERWDPSSQPRRLSAHDRTSPKEKKHHNKLEKVSRSMHEIIHDLRLDSGNPHQISSNHNKRSRRSRRCSKCQDNSSPSFCPHCEHSLDLSNSRRDSADSEEAPSSHQAVVLLKRPTLLSDASVNFVAGADTARHRLVPLQTRVSHSISDAAAMLASKGLRIYEDTGEYVPMKSPDKSPTLASSLAGPPFNLEASYLIVPTILESFQNNVDITQNPEGKIANVISDTETKSKSYRQLATDALAQRSISDSGATALRLNRYFPHEDEVNNGAHSDGDLCDEESLTLGLEGSRPRAMSVDMLCSDGAIPDGEDSTDQESSTAVPQKPTSRLRRKDRRSSKGYVEWRTCSGWVGKTDMRLAEGRNSRGYIEWDTIWSTATPWKTDGGDDEHVYDVINDESESQGPELECAAPTQTSQVEEEAVANSIDTPPALPERTYINRLKNANSPVQYCRRHSPHNQNSSNSHHQHHHHHHHHQNHQQQPHSGSHNHSSHHHHHHSNSPRHQHNHSHTNNGGRRSHGHHHHHRSSPQSAGSNATPKLKSASKPPPPAPPVDSQNYAQVSKLKGYTFSDPLTSPSATGPHPPNPNDKSVIYSENYWHINPVTSEERMTSWQSGDVLDYIDGLHDSMSPKRRENIYILLNNKKTRAKFSESLEIESRLLSKGLLCRPGNGKLADTDPNTNSMDLESRLLSKGLLCRPGNGSLTDTDPNTNSMDLESRLLSKGLLCRPGNRSQPDTDPKPEDMDTSTATSSTTTVTTTTHDSLASTSSVQSGRKVRTSVSSTYV